MLTAGYLIPGVPFELVAAGGLIRGTGASSLLDQNEVGGGLGYYFAQHLLKLQSDLFHLWAPGGFSAGDSRWRVQLQASL